MLAQDFDTFVDGYILFLVFLWCIHHVCLFFSDAIIAWVKKSIGPAVADISTKDEAKKILETGNTIVVAVFDKLEVSIFSRQYTRS